MGEAKNKKWRWKRKRREFTSLNEPRDGEGVYPLTLTLSPEGRDETGERNVSN
jgi:hypothetical protein